MSSNAEIPIGRVLPCPSGVRTRRIGLLFGGGHGYQSVLGVPVTVFVGWLLFLIATSPRLGLMHGIVAHATFNATAFLCVGAPRS